MPRPRLTYANVMSTGAMFIALGGTSYAVARNSIGARELKRNAVTSSKIKGNAVTSSKIRNGSIRSTDLSSSAKRGPRGMRGPIGPPGVGAPGPPGPSSVRASTSEGVTLSRSALARTQVAKIDGLVPGAYLLQFKGDVWYRPNTHVMYTICEIEANGQVLVGTRVIVGDAPGGNGTVDISTMRTYSSVDRFIASVACYSDQSAPQPPTPRIESPILTALRVDSIG